MNKLLIAPLVLALPNLAWADEPYFEFDLGVSNDVRGGNALNFSGGTDEVPEFSLAKIDGLAAITLDTGLLVQGGIQLDGNFANAASSSTAGADDTYRQGAQLSLQLGQHLENHYLGAYAVVGRVAFNPSDVDQDADFQSFGLQAAWFGESWQVSGSLGVLDSQAENPETISNALLVAVSGGYDLSASTRLNGSLTVMDGDQDTDSGSGADPVQILEIGIEIEHLVRETSYGSLAIYGGLTTINVWEDSSSTRTDHVSDTVLSAGIRMRFGANSAAASDRRKSPPLPEMLRAIGAVPAVD